jgi:hypothetical protein
MEKVLVDGSRFRIYVTALLILIGGISMAYMMTYYATTSIPHGHISHPACCLVYSLQPLSWYLGWRCSNRLNHWLRIGLMVVVAVAAEFACARIATPVWIVTNPLLFLADTPICFHLSRVWSLMAGVVGKGLGQVVLYGVYCGAGAT